MSINDDIQWPIPEDELRKIFGCSRLTARRKLWNLIEGEDYIKGHPGKKGSQCLFKKSGAIKLAKHMRKPSAKNFLRKYGETVENLSPIETDNLITIINAVEGFTAYETEYYVNYDDRYYGYRIDLYLKDLNIAIECDEHGHEERDEWDENFRQQEIERFLKCKFIRFNPHDQNFNIGNVINQIFSEIINKK